MMRSLFSGVSGLKGHQTAMDTIGNNIANVNTTAFKSSRVIFSDLVSQTVSEATAPTNVLGGRNSKQVGLGMSISAISRDMTEGSAQNTDGPLDFSVAGEGYFVVRAPNGGYTYTRNGNFTLDSQGFLVTQSGEYVLGQLGNETEVADGVIPDAVLEPIQMLGTVGTENYVDYAIDAYGKITVTNGAGNIVTIGRLVLASFNNPGGLDALGDSKLEQSSNSGTAVIRFVGDRCGQIQSGQLEMSNVSLATELTNLIIIQRGYQANSRVITTSDAMLEELVNLKR